MTDLTMHGLVSARAEDDAVGLRFEDRSWSWVEVVSLAHGYAGWMASLDAGDKRVPHVGVAMENLPDYVFLLLGAALSGAVLVGLNPTRTGAALRRDIEHTDVDVVVTGGSHRDMVFDCGAEVPVLDVGQPRWTSLVTQTWSRTTCAAADPADPAHPYVLILTSGTTSAPKAVVCSTGKIASQGSVVPHLVKLTASDTTYLAMPLFHSNAIIAGFAPTLAVGGTLALARRFSASTFLDDVRGFGATYANYVGTPLSYVLAQPERADDGDNPLRVVFGNEAAPNDIRRFGRRFDCDVLDAYGSTEGGISILRTAETPDAALGVGVGDIAVLRPDGSECAVAVFDEHGRLTNPDEAVGELVNLAGAGAFEGYWHNPDAVAERMVDGHYHSGDLGYRDADGFLYFAGRMNDWLRVGGENFAAGPIQQVLSRHPHVVEAVVLGVPDAVAGDQVLAVLVAPNGLDLDEYTTWLGQQDDLGARWLPHYLRVADDLPRTGTGKVMRERLRAAAWTPEGTLVRDGDGYRPMRRSDRAELAERFVAAGRRHVLEMVEEAS